jgi:hypothetical protein
MDVEKLHGLDSSERMINRVKEAYETIEEAYLRDQLVLFVGSGISRRVGANDWGGFANAIFEQLIRSDTVNVNHNLYNQIKHYSPRKRLSFAFELAKGKVELDFEKAIVPNEEKSNQDEPNVYDYLNQLDCNIVTTNYDLFLWEEPKESAVFFTNSDEEDESPIKRKQKIFNKQEINRDTLERNKKKIIHLHGCFKNENKELVVTTADYLEHYKPGDNNVLNFINNLFSDGIWTILFLGYGLEEMEILEHLIRRDGALTDGLGKKKKIFNRFWLEGFYSHQQEELELISKYYESNFRVNLIPYSLDINEYGQVDHVIKEWVKKLEFAKKSTPVEVVRMVKKVKGNG